MDGTTESAFKKLLGDKIRITRIDLGISIEKLSQISNISIENLTQIEDGTLSVHLTDFVSITKSLNVDPSILVDFKK